MSVLNEAEVLSRSRSPCLSKVKNLNCWGSDLVDISIIQNMKNLEVLNLSANNIVSLKDVPFCKHLRELYLRRNNIHIDEIMYLKDLPQLKVLWLSGNPCSDVSLYRETVLRHLPQLKKFDSIDVLESEITLAKKIGLQLEEKEQKNTTTVDIPEKEHTLKRDDDLKKAESTSKSESKEKLNEKENMVNKRFETDLVRSSVDIKKANELRVTLGLKPLNLGFRDNVKSQELEESPRNQNRKKHESKDDEMESKTLPDELINDVLKINNSFECDIDNQIGPNITCEKIENETESSTLVTDEIKNKSGTKLKSDEILKTSLTNKLPNMFSNTSSRASSRLQSNTLTAVMLLLETLSSNELLQVQEHSENLLKGFEEARENFSSLTDNL